MINFLNLVNKIMMILKAKTNNIKNTINKQNNRSNH